MNRRMRKKRHVGEYQEFGFHLRFRVREDAADRDFMKFWDEFILVGIEPNLLGFSGGCGESWKGFIVRLDRKTRGRRSGSVRAEQRFALEAWLSGHPRVFDLLLGPPVDAWHGPFED